jgi:sarcosine oxidase subunit gamma
VIECDDYALCMVIARDKSVPTKLEKSIGLKLPQKPRYVRLGSTSAVCIGPGQWLIRRDGSAGQALAAELEGALGGAAAVFDQTSGRAIFRFSGPQARAALTKGVLLDLHPSVFGPGSAAATSIAYMAVTFWQVDDQPTYEFAIFRSFAESLWKWIVDASAEFGVELQFSNRA